MDNAHLKATAILLAAGKGQRMAMPGNKVWANLGGKPVLAWSLDLFQKNPKLEQIIIAAAKEELPLCLKIAEAYPKVSRVVEGGATRQESVANCLEFVDISHNWVLIHDGARPFLSERELDSLFKGVENGCGAILAVPVKNTIKIVDPQGMILKTPCRNGLYEAQTPQLFPKKAMLDAYAKVSKTALSSATDDASLLEACGYPVRVVKGSYDNLKLTTAEDWVFAQALLNRQALKED